MNQKEKAQNLLELLGKIDSQLGIIEETLTEMAPRLKVANQEAYKSLLEKQKRLNELRGRIVVAKLNLNYNFM